VGNRSPRPWAKSCVIDELHHRFAFCFGGVGSSLTKLAAKGEINTGSPRGGKKGYSTNAGQGRGSWALSARQSYSSERFSAWVRGALESTSNGGPGPSWNVVLHKRRDGSWSIPLCLEINVDARGPFSGRDFKGPTIVGPPGTAHSNRRSMVSSRCLPGPLATRATRPIGGRPKVSARVTRRRSWKGQPCSVVVIARGGSVLQVASGRSRPLAIRQPGRALRSGSGSIISVAAAIAQWTDEPA